ncbi:MAG TPA: insulinase family protein, partial [Roseiflexaceae bacterium]|nr:insulinase family protein [Roseiflexaceae bacterium]
RAINTSLFPGHVYGVDSGGDPAVIPDLTYEQFKSFHERFYHPSNARIFFYGDDPPAERLRLLDAVLSEFAARQPDSAIPLAPRIDTPRRVEERYSTSDQDGAKGFVTVNWMLGEISDPELMLGLGILEHILIGTSAAPLRKALIDSGLGERMAGSGLEELRQMAFSTGLKGVDPAKAEQVEQLILDTLAALASGGIDAGTVEASLNTVEFALRENNTGSYPRGLALMLRSLTTWLYDGDPFVPLQFEAPLAAIKARIADGERYFEGLIEQYLLENKHRTTLVLRPDAALGAELEQAEQARLEAVRRGMSDDDLHGVVETTRRLNELQEAPDPPEALAALPSLGLGDLPRENKEIPIDEEQRQDALVLRHDLFTNGIVYLDLGFDLHTLDQTFLPYVKLFGRALLETGTAGASPVQLQQRIGRETGGIHANSFASSVRGSDESRARLFVRGKAT